MMDWQAGNQTPEAGNQTPEADHFEPDYDWRAAPVPTDGQPIDAAGSSFDSGSGAGNGPRDGRSGARVAAAVATVGLLVIAASVVALGGLGAGPSADASPTATTAALVSPAPTVATASPSLALETPASAPVVIDPSASGAGTALPAVDVEAATVADRVVPSVVYVEVLRPGRGGQLVAVASGSGVVLDSSGRIVTNNHVVASGSDYRVVLSDGRTYTATLLGADDVTDLALLDINADNLDAIELGSSDALRVGDPAIAVGSPLGLQGGPSLTVGVISAFGREVDVSSTSSLFGMLQTDAAITEGSSGGALVDADGRLVGITTAVGVSSVGVEGIGFATPVEIVARVVDELATRGVASQPGLGITGETAYRELSDGGQAPVGVRLVSVAGDSAAAAAGLAPGDVIARIGTTPIDTMEELVAALRRYSAGDTITITIDGTGTTRAVPVTLQDL